MEKLLRDYGRLLLLEGQIPELAEEKETARRELLAAERSLSEKRLAWQQWEKPGFFQRLMGKTEEKRDLAYREYQQEETAFRRAEHRKKAADTAYDAVRAELDSLDGISEQCLQAMEAGDREALAEIAVQAFAPAALAAAERCLAVLESARDIYREPVRHGLEYRRTELFAQAASTAKQLLWMLEQFPKPEDWICPYIANPNGFLLMATEYTRRDRLNEAIDQVRELRNRLKRER